MAKFVFVFVLALFALQGSDARHLREDAAENNVQDLVTELKTLVHETASRIAGVYTELKDKFSKLEDEANIPSLVADFMQQVDQLQTHDGAAACETVAQQQIFQVQRLAAVISCKIELDEEMSALGKQLEVLTSNVGGLLKDFGRDVYTCMRGSHGSHEQFTQCMEKIIYNVEQDLQAVKQEIDVTFNDIEKSIPDITAKISTCVTDHKEKLVAEIAVAVDTIKKCVDGDNVAPVSSKKSGIVNAATDVNDSTIDLIAELKTLIHETATRFADVYTELKDKFSKIEDDANIPSLVADFTQQVDQLKTHDGAAACQTVTQQQTFQVQRLASVLSCKFEVDEEMSALRKQLEVLTSKVGGLLKDFGRDVYTCMRDNHGSYEQFTQCMNKNVYNVEQDLQVVKQEIEVTFNDIEKSIPDFTAKFSICVADHKEKLVAEIAVAVDTIQKCVDGDNVAPVSSKKSGIVNAATDVNDSTIDLIEELKTLIHETATRFADVYTELKNKFSKIEDEAQIPSLVADFAQQVDQLKTHDGAAACETVSQQQTLQVQRFAAVISCKFEADEEMSALGKQLEVLTSKVGGLLSDFTLDVFNCMRGNHGSQEQFTQCMNKSVYNVEQDLQVVKQEIEVTFNDIEKSIPDFTAKFSTCVADHKEQLVAEIAVAVDTIKKCVDGDKVASIKHADLLY